MSDTLPTRLRSLADLTSLDYDEPEPLIDRYRKEMREAATAIEELTKERDELRQIVQFLNSNYPLVLAHAITVQKALSERGEPISKSEQKRLATLRDEGGESE
jgi:predicted ribosome quality control (RQC) complex YloA/Tae2 family protein